MNLFVDYVQPLTNWLQANPHWSLFITFIIALTESLAIIGSIVPGSVTMTAIGMLAGLGIMRIDLTLIAATLGAVCGDSLSYALGYYYSEHLVDIWPFKKYPGWLKYGKDFFSRHGGKSVLIGRFVGPLRSIIPVIAGILHMKQWRFLIANVISAVGWSFLYIMPGVLIGAAGNELSAETATRLFIIVLILIAGIWIASTLIKWILIRLHSFTRNKLHYSWLKLKKHPQLIGIYTALTPIEEQNHYPTAGLVFLTIFSILGFIILLLLSIQAEWIKSINVPIYLFIQSFHPSLLEALLILCTQLTSSLTMISLYIICCFWFIIHKNPRTIIYLSSLIVTSFLVAFALSHCIYSPRPQGMQVIMQGNSFPAFNLLIATAFYGFILYYVNKKYSLLTNSVSTFIFIVLGLSGFGAIYLGDYWFTDVLAAYFIGTAICLICCIIYRRFNLPYTKETYSVQMIVSIFISIIFFSILSTSINFKALVHDHTPYHKEYNLDKSMWWDQKRPILPLYRLSRVGRKISILNIQYSGNLNLLQKKLELNGWKVHTETFLTKVLMRMSSKSNGIKLPLLAQLYENKRPELIMTYTDKKSQMVLELSIWESNYYLYQLNRPLWIGAIHQNSQENKKVFNPLSYLIPALNQFTLRRMEIPQSMLRPTSFPTTPYILLIKNPTETD